MSYGADNETWTHNLTHTKGALCQLSYTGVLFSYGASYRNWTDISGLQRRGNKPLY